MTSREQLVEDIKCLEKDLTDLRGRFDVIVSWIRSEYDDELSGLPEYVMIAVLGNQNKEFVVEKELTTHVKVETGDQVDIEKAKGDSVKTIESESSYPQQDYQCSSPFTFVGANNLKLEGKPAAADHFSGQNEANERDGDNPLTNGIKSSLSVRTSKRVSKNAKLLETNENKVLVVNADEYIRLTESLFTTRLNCVICNKKFQYPSRLRSHEFRVHLAKEDQIKVKTLRATGRKSNLPDAKEYIRMTESLSNTRLRCVFCGWKFSSYQRVRSHELRAHVTKEDQTEVKALLADEMEMCEVCDKPVRDIASHRKIHLPPEVVIPVKGQRHPCYRCQKCDVMLWSKKTYRSHMASGCKNMEGICEIADLAQRMEDRQAQKTFLCNECGLVFNRKYTLKIHVMAIHAKRKDFKCRYCDTAFTVESNRNSHERKHLGTSTVTCDLCGFNFTCKQILKKHIRGVHENRRPFPCRLCDKSFKTAINRGYHINTHGNPNGRKRGLNREVDPVKAGGKRRQTAGFMKNRLQKVSTENEKSIDTVTS